MRGVTVCECGGNRMAGAPNVIMTPMSTTARVSTGANAKDLRARIEARTAKVGIVGMGYVGLPLALLFSERDFPVLGFDIDANKVNSLNSGKSYIYRIPETEIASAKEKGF